MRAGDDGLRLPGFIVREIPTAEAELAPFAKAMEAACKEAGYPNATATVVGFGVFMSGDVPPAVVEKAWEVCRGIV